MKPKVKPRSNKQNAHTKAAENKAEEQSSKEEYNEDQLAEEEEADEDSSSSLSSSDYDTDDEEDQDVVETEEDAIYVYRKRLEGVEKERGIWKSHKPAMFADLLRSLGSEARALAEASSKFANAKTDKDPVLLLKICHKKLRHYSSSRGVTREVRSAKSLYNIHQWASEHTSDYYQRFVREVEEYETFHTETVSEKLKSALFTEGLHNSRYGGLKVDIENGVLKQKQSLASAYNQALKHKIRNPEQNSKTTGILASSFLTSNKRQEKGQTNDKEANEQNAPKGASDKRSFKYPCTTCKLLGITSTDHRAHECPNEKKAADMLTE